MTGDIERLAAFDITKGSPFPFAVDVVADVAANEPGPLTVATDGKLFRVADDLKDNTTPNALRAIVRQLAPELKEYQQPPPDDDSGTTPVMD